MGKKQKTREVSKYDENGRMYLPADARNSIFVEEFPEFRHFEQ
jgi:hypothetical protein